MIIMPRTLFVLTKPRASWQIACRNARYRAACLFAFVTALGIVSALLPFSAEAQTTPDPNAGKPDGYYLQSYSGGTYTRDNTPPTASYHMNVGGNSDMYGCDDCNASLGNTASASGTITGTFLWHSDAGNPPPQQVIEAVYSSVTVGQYTDDDPTWNCDNGFGDNTYFHQEYFWVWTTDVESTGTHYRVRNTATGSTGTSPSGESFTSTDDGATLTVTYNPKGSIGPAGYCPITVEFKDSFTPV